MVNIKSKSGQSLVEILVALGVALLVVVALIRATAISLKGSGFSKSQARGTRYAQEAIEWIRGQRDEGWSNLASRTPETGVATYCLNDLSDWPASSGECPDYNLDSQYKREATLSNEEEGKIEVEVTVKWVEVGGERESRVTTYFTNWRGGLAETTGTPAPTATLTPTPVPTATPTPAEENLIDNPDFEAGTSGWFFQTNGSGNLSATTPAYAGSLSGRIMIIIQGTAVQLYQKDIHLAPDTNYRLSFVAFSNTGHDLQVYIHKHTNTAINYGLNAQYFNLGTSWQTFSVDFTSTSSAGPDARLRFQLAQYDADGDYYWFDEITLTEIP